MIHITSVLYNNILSSTQLIYHYNIVVRGKPWQQLAEFNILSPSRIILDDKVAQKTNADTLHQTTQPAVSGVHFKTQSSSTGVNFLPSNTLGAFRCQRCIVGPKGYKVPAVRNISLAGKRRDTEHLEFPAGSNITQRRSFVKVMKFVLGLCEDRLCYLGFNLP